MSEFLMPSLGADMEAGTLVEWLVKLGDQVNRGDVIAVVETQKGAIEIEVFEDGILEEYLVDIGKKVPVGTPLATIKRIGEKEPTVSDPLADRTEVTPAIAKKEKSEPALKPVFTTQKEGRIYITPAARRRLEAAGFDLTSLEGKGTGPSGEITLVDIDALMSKKPDISGAVEPAVEPTEMTGMRAAIAAAMSRSKREIPHYYLAHTIDLTLASSFVTDVNVSRPPAERLLLGALYMKAVSKAVKKFPEFNGHFIDSLFRQSGPVHVGMAIKLRGGGLVAPAIHNTQNLNLDDTMSAMRDLIARVRAGRFKSSEISDSTITISSLGERGVETLYGIIYPPQVAIIGFGTPLMRPWVCGEKVEIRQTVTVTLAADHRVSDGHRGSLFLNAIGNFLQEPETL